MDKVDGKINDLLQYIDTSLNDVRDGFRMNEYQNASLTSTTLKRDNIRFRLSKARDHIRTGEDLTKRSKVILTNAHGYFHTLDEALVRMDRRGQKLEHLEYGLSEVVEDYRSKYVLPCQANSEQLLYQAEQLQMMFENMVGVNAEQALQVGHVFLEKNLKNKMFNIFFFIQAANVYQTIIFAIDNAREAGFKALDAAALAFKRADPPGQDHLGVRAEMSRVRSEDLSQESEGLRQNSVDMGYQLKKIRNQWQARIRTGLLGEKIMTNTTVCPSPGICSADRRIFEVHEYHGSRIGATATSGCVRFGSDELG